MVAGGQLSSNLLTCLETAVIMSYHPEGLGKELLLQEPSATALVSEEFVQGESK